MKEESVIDERGGKPSASGMQRLALCPGSWLAEKAYPEESSEAAEAGTRLHKHMEEGTLPEDATEAEAVEWCLDMERNLADEYVQDISPSHREERWWDAQGLFSGQADVVYSHRGTVLVLDYKFGRVPVPVANSNLQLAALALLAFDNVPGAQVVFCGILQPFVSRQVPGLVRYQREDVSQLRRYFAGLVQQACQEGAPRHAGEQQCRYCRAKADCPACMALLSAAAGNDSLSGSGVTPALRSSGQSVAELWSDWSAEKKAEAVRLAGLAKKWAEAVERRAKADLKDGVAIPGWKLGAGRKSFKVTDAQGAFSHLNGLIGLSGEVFASCCTVSISALDKVVHGILSEQAPEGVKQKVKDSAAWLRTALEDFGAESVSEGSLQSE